jgi:hypothetical protein
MDKVILIGAHAIKPIEDKNHVQKQFWEHAEMIIVSNPSN